MPGLERLAHRDLDGILGFAIEAAAADGGEPFELAVIDRLACLVPSDQAGYYDYRARRNHSHRGHYQDGMFFLVKQPGIEPPWGDELDRAWWRWPLNDFRNSQRVHALRFSDGFATTAEKRRNPWYLTAMRPNGIEHEIDLWLPAPDGVVRAFFFVRERGRRDFSERDRTVLTLLRSHLIGIRERWQRQHRPASLTPREGELLGLLRMGLTNKEIAERLVISPTTVRTHLSNLFEKLGVHTRTAAATHDFNPIQRPDGRR